MSKDLAQFIERLGQDSALQERLKGPTDQEGTAKLAVQLGTELGYRFTAEDVLAALQKRGELNEGELEQVAGGAVERNTALNLGFSLLRAKFGEPWDERSPQL